MEKFGEMPKVKVENVEGEAVKIFSFFSQGNKIIKRECPKCANTYKTSARFYTDAEIEWAESGLRETHLELVVDPEAEKMTCKDCKGKTFFRLSEIAKKL